MGKHSLIAAYNAQMRRQGSQPMCPFPPVIVYGTNCTMPCSVSIDMNTLYNFGKRLSGGTRITVKNCSSNTDGITVEIGTGPIGDYYQSAISTGLTLNQSYTYTVLNTDNITSLYFHPSA